ncbi:MAG TPA: hypothetical protein VFA41_12230 [Ktedonobacteraceae bacterium]|jgi:hypothetical protein|nr:hypothetical protein [Ktedonobacteraceae bacterium]
MSSSVEDGGALEDWPPVDERHRTDASRVQQVFSRIIKEFVERVRTLDPQGDKIEGGTLEPWESPEQEWD